MDGLDFLLLTASVAGLVSVAMLANHTAIAVALSATHNPVSSYCVVFVGLTIVAMMIACTFVLILRSIAHGAAVAFDVLTLAMSLGAHPPNILQLFVATIVALTVFGVPQSVWHVPDFITEVWLLTAFVRPSAVVA
jgi:hypothetical protein